MSGATVVDDAVAAGLADSVEDVEVIVPDAVTSPKVVEVDTSGERDDDGNAVDAEPTRLPVHVDSSMALVPAREELRGLTEMAVTLAIADNVPKALRGKPAAILAVLLTGRELEIPPMTALRNLHVIDGQVTVNPKIRAAMVRRQGLGKLWPHQGPRDVPCPLIERPTHAAGCDVCNDTGKVRQLCECGRDDPDNDAEVCTWHAKRADDPRIIYSSTYTMTMARAVTNYVKEGKTHYLADKDNWKNYPERMLSWRSLGYLLDDAFPEIGTGLYTPDEIGAITDEDGLPVIDVDSTESLTSSVKTARGGGSSAPREDPPASPDTIAEFQRRIEAIKSYEGASNQLLGLWNGYRGEGKDRAEPLPKVKDLLYRHCPTATGLIAMIERRIQKGEFKQIESDAEIVPDASVTDHGENPENDREGDENPSDEESPAPDPDVQETLGEIEDSAVEEPVSAPTEDRVFEFDVEGLPTEFSTGNDLAWIEAATKADPEAARAMIDEVAVGVQAIDPDQLLGVMKLLDLSAQGLNEATKRARIATRRVRLRIMKDAGL